MKTFTKDLPTMYGDHHVVEVRRILLELPGVREVYASSAFRVVEVEYDPEAITEEQIEKHLEEAGYAGELPIVAETGIPAHVQDGTFFRHTAAYKQTADVVTFAQSVDSTGRALWPCPGVGVVTEKMEE